jgi:hypothetical protein
MYRQLTAPKLLPRVPSMVHGPLASSHEIQQFKVWYLLCVKLALPIAVAVRSKA